MTKQESLMMKGMAILIMLFGHLFSHENIVESQCINMFHIQGIPLSTWLSHAAHPVDFYLFLSGVGLTYINAGGG